MWNDLSELWQTCLALSWQSYCEGSLPIAAVITHPDGTIVARGRNRISGTTPTSPKEIIGVPLAHAEVNALLALDYSAVNPFQLTLYTTVEPCPLCIGAICMVGIKQVWFAARDVWAGSTNLLQATPYLQGKKITAHGPADGGLETLIQILQIASLIRYKSPRGSEALALRRKDNPRNVAVGERLYQSGELEKLRQINAPIEAVVKRLTDLMNI